MFCAYINMCAYMFTGHAQLMFTDGGCRDDSLARCAPWSSRGPKLSVQVPHHLVLHKHFLLQFQGSGASGLIKHCTQAHIQKDTYTSN